MNNDGLNKVRALLINTGKALPFILCAVVMVSYTETLFALVTSDFLLYDDSLIPNKPYSWFLGSYFEYNIQLLFIVVVITFAIRTCIWNKLCVLYLTTNLIEKSYFTFEMYIEYVYFIVITNIIVSGLFVYKGIKILKIAN